jgi:hypothetical protein
MISRLNDILFCQVIIATNKKRLSEAKAYFNFLRDTLADRPLLKYVHLDSNSVKFWDILIFKDKTNFIGIPASEQPILDVKELGILCSFFLFFLHQSNHLVQCIE